jgi:hypothetical protein
MALGVAFYLFLSIKFLSTTTTTKDLFFHLLHFCLFVSLVVRICSADAYFQHVSMSEEDE